MIKEGKQERSHNKSSKHPKDHYQFYNLRKGNENTIPNNGIRTRGLKNIQESANIKSGKKQVTANIRTDGRFFVSDGFLFAFCSYIATEAGSSLPWMKMATFSKSPNWKIATTYIKKTRSESAFSTYIDVHKSGFNLS